MKIEDSELVLNPDGSVYHVNLLPEHIQGAHSVILVGDPDRVELVSKHFDQVQIKRSKREIVAHAGTLKGKKFVVISTGMGPDNIDIVINELDALVNIDLQKREAKKELASLNIVRIGTSGSLQAEIPVDSFVLSRYGIGFDGVMHFYDSEHIQEHEIQDAYAKHADWAPPTARPYVIKGNEELFDKLYSSEVFEGFTGTAVGFYGPQGRTLRLTLADVNMNEKMETFSYMGMKITNYEMETAAIYGLSKLLGHKALSANCIVANRASKTFSKDPYASIEKLIKYILNRLSE